VDILIEIEEKINMDKVASAIIDSGYIKMSESAERMSFNKGYSKPGFADEVFHLHLRYAGDNEEIYFRDYLIAHPNAAKEYEKLKLTLWHQYEHNRDGYTNAKTGFVRKYTTIAKAQEKKKIKHEMSLWNNPFQSIKNGLKTVEMRLNDEKRNSIKSGDAIIFTNKDTKETIEAVVMKVDAYSDFHELYKHCNKMDIGYGENETANPDDMLLYYSQEQIQKYGALAIAIKLID